MYYGIFTEECKHVQNLTQTKRNHLRQKKTQRRWISMPQVTTDLRVKINSLSFRTGRASIDSKIFEPLLRNFSVQIDLHSKTVQH
jgi:hypothetical protein